MGNNALLMKKHLMNMMNVNTSIGAGYKDGRATSLPMAGGYMPRKQRIERDKNANEPYHSKFY